MASIVRVINGQRVSDGAGVDIRRVIGLAGADYIDPFLMFDDFRNDHPESHFGSQVGQDCLQDGHFGVRLAQGGAVDS